MPNLIPEVLRLLEPDLNPPLFSRASVERLESVSHLFPDIPRLGIECRLDDDDRVDLSQAVFNDDAELSALLESLELQRSVNPEIQQLDRLINYVGEWSDNSSLLNQRVGETWFEYDLLEGSRSTVPSVFVGLNPRRYESASNAEVIDRSIELLTGQKLDASRLKILHQCFELLPPESKLLHVGTMLSRAENTIRINIQRIGANKIGPFLDRIGWKGDAAECTKWLNVAEAFCDDVRLDLDLGETILPACSLEFFISEFPPSTVRWTPLLNYLKTEGICSPSKAEMLNRWPGHLTPPNVTESWPDTLLKESLVRKIDRFSVLTRNINHIKISPGAVGGVAAKAYLGFFHSWITHYPS